MRHLGSCGSQHAAQLSNLLARVLVERDRGFIHDITRAVRVFQGVEGLVKVRVGGGDTSHHDRPRVSPQGILQQAGQFRVAVRNVPARVPTLVVSERTDHIPECEQPLINLNALLQSLSLRLGALGALRSRQIHEMHLRSGHVRGVRTLSLDVNRENGVRARRTMVHASRSGGSRLGTVRERLRHLFHRGHLQLLDANENHAGPAGRVSKTHHALGLKQVADVLLVDFDETHAEVHDTSLGKRGDVGEEGLHDARDDAARSASRLVRGAHGVRLAGARLTVREHSGVVAGEQTVHQRFDALVVESLLRGTRAVIHVVVRELVFGHEGNGRVRVVREDALLAPVHELGADEGTHHQRDGDGKLFLFRDRRRIVERIGGRVRGGGLVDGHGAPSVAFPDMGTRRCQFC